MGVQEGIRRGRRNIDNVLGRAPVLLFAVDRSGVVTFLEGRRGVLGIDPQAAVGRPAVDVFVNAPELAGRLHGSLNGDSFAGIVQVASTGSYIDLTCHYSPESGPEGGVVGALIDITEWMQAEEVRRRDDDRQVLVATLNHETRTPLNAILGFAELLKHGRHGELTDAQRRYVDNIQTAGRHLLGLVGDSLDLSRPELGRAVIQPVLLDLLPILEEVKEQLQPVASSREVRLLVECPANLTVLGDRRRLVHVMWILVSNAIKFTPARGTVLETARASGKLTSIDVRDTGAGMPSDRLARIFLEFTQDDPAVEGSGLGLAITRNLVTLMGGRITVASSPGVGTTFTVMLPRGQKP